MNYFIKADIKFNQGGQFMFTDWSLPNKEPIEDTFKWIDKWVIKSIFKDKSEIKSAKYTVTVGEEVISVERSLIHFQ